MCKVGESMGGRRGAFQAQIVAVPSELTSFSIEALMIRKSGSMSAINIFTMTLAVRMTYTGRQDPSARVSTLVDSVSLDFISFFAVILRGVG